MRRLCHCGDIQPCEKHAYKQGKRKATDYDNQWRIMSERIRANDPLCADCWTNGRSEPSTECHHIRTIDEAPHLKFVGQNIVALCTGCHTSRHRRMKAGHEQTDFTK